jgi:hypothetical protein
MVAALGRKLDVAPLQRHRFGAIVLVAISAGCHWSRQHDSTLRYLVTEGPVNVGLSQGLCLAIDPNDEHGVWWWEPGASGCATRSTGPNVFQGDQARVSRSSDSSTTAGFRLGTHSRDRPFIDVRLILERGQMRAIDTGAQVPVQPRSDLDIPEMAPRGVR